MKVFIIASRIGTDLQDPFIVMTRQEADAFAEQFLFSPAASWYLDTHDDPLPDIETLQEAANDEGCTYSSSYFWDGRSDAYEVRVTECDLPKKTLHIRKGGEI